MKRVLSCGARLRRPLPRGRSLLKASDINFWRVSTGQLFDNLGNYATINIRYMTVIIAVPASPELAAPGFGFKVLHSFYIDRRKFASISH